jgi:hypothetical protein
MIKDLDTKEKIMHEITEIIGNWVEYKEFSKEADSFEMERKKWGALPHHPIRNVVIWSFDIALLLGETLLSLKNMMSAARYYRATTEENSLPSHTDKFVSFYANVLFVLIETIKDKIGLMVYSTLEDFDPGEGKHLPSFETILKKLREISKDDNSPHRKWVAETLLSKILPLDKNEELNYVERFRHSKIHRMEPRIEIFGIKPHHDWPYLVKISENDVSSEVKKIDLELKQAQPNDETRSRIIKRCFIDGRLYVDKKMEGRLFSYDEVEGNSIMCLKLLLIAITGCFKVIGPLLNNYNDLR